MAERDPELERRRLARWYAGISDAELREIAEDAGSLTDEAKAALRAEIARRGLDLALGELDLPVDESGPEAGPSGPIILRRYLWPHEALLAKTILDSAGVECILGDEHTIRMDWFWSLALGEVKLWVRGEDADAAELLDQGWIESFMVSGVGEYVQPRCPNCQSFEISYKGLLERMAYLSLLGFWLAGVVPPIALHEIAWKCAECGYLWEEDSGKNEPMA